MTTDYKKPKEETSVNYKNGATSKSQTSRKTITNPKSEIDLRNQTNGIYFVKIDNGQTILTTKIVIQ